MGIFGMGKWKIKSVCYTPGDLLPVFLLLLGVFLYLLV